MLSCTGYEAGGVAPFGHVVTPAHTFVEERVFANEVVWCGGGIKPAMLRVTPGDLLRGTSGTRCNLAAEEE